MKTNSKQINCFTVLLILTGFSFFSSCKQKATLFQSLPSSQTSTHFNNKVVEDDKYNVLAYINIYTGAGVAVGRTLCYGKINIARAIF